ncbi:MAG TPA: ATP-binding cassette domain-containing protein [Acidimicrobiales bacterium]|nr:ATP-binding cassette domain-containing protein [Acidimicrobiales bacterium]
MTAADGTVVRLARVQKSFAAPAGPRRVLDGLDLTVVSGEIVAVAGRSGSGKTTLLTILAGWEEPDAGTAVVLGVDAGDRPRPWQELAVLPQSLGLLEELTVAENIALPLRLDTTPGAGDPDTLMRQLGVDHLADRYPSEVSLGEQQRTALARAVVVRPRLLLADEPVAHQNVEWAEAMMFVLRRLADGGTACVLASHNRAALDGADRVLELHAGRLHSDRERDHIGDVGDSGST